MRPSTALRAALSVALGGALWFAENHAITKTLRKFEELVRSQFRWIIEHLLKLEHSPATDPRFGWRESVIEARDVVADLMTATLRDVVEAGLAMTYQQGRWRADAALKRHGEHEAVKALPGSCPYSFDQIVHHDWCPANRHHIVDPGDG